MAKITFTEELLNKPIIPKYNKNLEQSESDDDAEPAALNFGESKEAFDKLTKEQESYLKKQDKITKKNKNLIQMRNLIQKKESEQRKAELNESKNDKSKEQLKMEKLKAFDEQLKQMEAKAARNRTKTGFEEDENLEELDLGFLESIESEPKQTNTKKIFKDEDFKPKTHQKYDAKRDDYVEIEKQKNTSRVSKLKLLRQAKNKTERVKQNGILIEKLSVMGTKTNNGITINKANGVKPTVKNTKLAKLRSKLLK
ncbi:hypothetical protein ACO0OL_000125 [Hanseniaspora opuntiae]